MVDRPSGADGEPPDGPEVSAGPLCPVGRTLLLTLRARAEETRRPDAIRRDPEAEAMLPRLRHELPARDAPPARRWKTQVGVAVRGRRIDEAVERFAVRHPEGIVIDLGAGLDGRPRRLGGPGLDWLLVDRPEVLDLRRRLLPPGPREHLHAGSLEEASWIDRVRAFGPRPRLIIAEGVLMFVPRADVLTTLGRIAERLPGTRVVADVIGGLMVRCPWLHDTLPSTGVRFAWGLRRLEEPATWDPRIRLEAAHALLLDGGPRWRWMRLLRPFPVMRRQFVLLEVRCGMPPDAGSG
jgi:O-methyltransferase involved in polyketide biosynthesis